MTHEEEEEETRTLLVVREVCVYKIPVRSTSGGYKCGEWLQSDKIWTGRLRVVANRSKCQIRLEDSNTGELFAMCPVEAGKREASVESALDSSRYFVLRIDDGGGRHAFIGLGFNERSDAFDFNVALSDHEKYVKRDDALDLHHHDHDTSSNTSALDLRLKDGETLKINVKTRSPASSGMMKNAASVMSSNKQTGGKLFMAPPPGGGRIRSPLPPPPSDMPTASSACNKKEDVLSDLSQLQAALPPDGSTKSKTSGATGWAAF